ncbi:hypothetical protein [Deinococcus humi]|uniref:Uncharacterized protein n=1 Tax=Deinococcus humi TaxID=662880 RepID=A0A7W8JU81_9DEIO|nr:hypothetical protein [Deinococcus humi]MBB5363040.1 hypothetical protein [Deinococcus humi]
MELIQIFSLPARLHFHPAKLALLPVAYSTFGEAVRRTDLGLVVDDPAFGQCRPGQAANHA